MSNTIKLKRGTSTPSVSDISNGEVAIDTQNKKLYINDSGTVKEIGGGGGGGLTSDSDKNTIGGTNAGDSITSGSGLNNTLIGYNAGTAITTGDKNVAIGSEALKSNVTIGNQTAIGYQASYSHNGTSIEPNTTVGYQAGYSGTTTERLTAGGHQAAYSMTTASWNTAYGYKALYLSLIHI